MKKTFLCLTSAVFFTSYLFLTLTAVNAQENNSNSSLSNSLDNKSSNLRSEELLESGYAKGNLGKFREAINDFDAALMSRDIKDDMKAKAFRNRGVAKSHLGNHQAAIDDYTAALSVPGIQDSTKALALCDRGNSKEGQAAIDDYNAALSVPGIKDDTKVMALYNRGVAKSNLGNHQAAIDDYNAALSVPGIKDDTKANTLHNLEITKNALLVNPAPFGLEIGKATLKDLKTAGHSIIYSDKSLWDGMIYKVDTRSLGLEGLQEASFIFNDQEILQAVLLVMNKDHFSFMLNSLSEKYKLVRKDIPFVGNRQARFSKGQCVIDMDSPHLSFSFEIAYMTKEFEEIYKKKHQHKVDQKEKEQKALL